jgi:hypothetical protein
LSVKYRKLLLNARPDATMKTPTAVGKHLVTVGVYVLNRVETATKLAMSLNF